MGWGERARKASVSCNKYLYQLLVLRDLNKVKANNHHNFMSRMIAFDTLTSTDNLEGTDKTTLHAYGPIYDELFHPRKDKVRNVLEIGVLSGASLVNLANFFPQANILGIDIDLKNVRYGTDNPRVTMIECDATKVEDFTLSLITLAGFDIVIDDGSHAPEDMVASFVIWSSKVKSGGLYVIEDVTEDALRICRPIFELMATKEKMSMNVVDLRHIKGRFDDIMIIFERPN